MKIKIIFFVMFLILNTGIFADTKNRETSSVKFLIGVSNDFDIINNQNIGFWGFYCEDVEKQNFSGYYFGLILSFRFFDYFDFFTDITIHKASLLMGKAGSRLKGIAIWDADPYHTSFTSPKLPNDIYYISNSTIGKIGTRFIYPINENFEPFIGVGLGIVSYEIGFGNVDGSRAYSNIVNDFVPIYSFILGFDIKVDIITFGLNFEFGGAATSPGTIIKNWIWEGWTYHAQFPLVPSYRVGITLGVII